MFHGYFISDLWWIFPLFMLVLCILMMSRGRIGCMMGRHMSEDMKNPPQTDTLESALDILNKRYARGEIDGSEYEAKKSAITTPK